MPKTQSPQQKAWETRRANEKFSIRSAAAFKAHETRLANDPDANHKIAMKAVKTRRANAAKAGK